MRGITGFAPIRRAPGARTRAARVLPGGRFAVALVVLMLAGACTAQTVHIPGTTPPVEALTALEYRKSTAAQVRSALGEPSGYGMMRHSPDVPLARVWYYERVLVKGDQIRLHILLVYLHDEIYQGHFWFAADELYKTTL